MTWLVPSALAVTGVAALVAIALHFIARSRPIAETLPTARFIPLRAVHARTRSVALSDVLLLLLRLAAIAAIGAAVAGPVVARARGRVARIVLADRSRDVASVAELRDSVRSVARGGASIIAFDSIAAPISASAFDSLPLGRAAGSLSTALAAAARAAARVSPQSDSIELVIVSAFGDDEFDAATARLRATWGGRARLVPVGGVHVSPAAPRVESDAGADDPVIAGLSLAVRAGGTRPVRVVRGRMTSSDSAWSRDSGHVVVHWPVADSAAGWSPRATIDAIGGVTSATGTLVGRFPRAWSLRGRAIARWVDGEPAAIETDAGQGCVRDVALLVDPASDLTLRQPFRRFVAALLAPCGGAPSARRLDDSTLVRLAGAGPLASSAAFRGGDESSSWTPWLLLIGALLLLAELAARRTAANRP